jgi:AraC-like DNA-binding protein
LSYRFSNEEFSYELVSPKGPVSLFVDFFGEVEFSPALDQPVPREILPFPGAELVLYVQGSGTYTDGLKQYKLPAQYLLGQPSATRHYIIEPGSRIFFIRFRQHFLKYILHDTAVWRDTLFDWSARLPASTCEVLLAIRSLQDLSERVTQAETSLEALLPDAIDPAFEWLKALDQLLDANDTVALLAKQLHISTRQLERRFLQYFDLSPKDYLRIRKLSAALDYYARLADSSVTDASYEGGFADQSHFIKTFKLYASEAPLKFFRTYKIKSD